ncbi:MAG: phytanoyl-CoA dioxygenase [Halieaceae bacterium MED-G27]|nr:phytanoyl-CoA dioxygenase [Halieaceae bacterium]OUT66895.1 MAG: phytanoyl-CoA dioxygenase [Cellvibrionales bacterium TMED21]PDH37806.1 MAG: phytanoyl-CoA dioxygenase [Halieaceae bacterium MED-G27]
MQDISRSIEACAAHYGHDAEAMKQYLEDGQRAALDLDNRGPIEFDQQGRLVQSILDAYSKYGFYVFTGVLSEEECQDLEADLEHMKTTFPTGPESKVDSQGRPAMGADSLTPSLVWSKPLGDPLGGTELANGRHQVKMFEPEAKEAAPAAAPFILLGSLRFSDACLRTYAHPELLRVAEAINGKDFAPFNEALFIKEPGIGAAVSWHQDGVTHWDSQDFDEGIHGFNFMAQLYGSTAVNGVWVLPGSHRLGKLDIKSLVSDSNSERLKGAVPLVCGRGDVVICNRQALHGSFPNSGFEPRLTVNFGFHRRSSVLGVQGGGIHSDAQVFDETIIARRSKVLGYAIAARKERFPEEQAYEYQPFKEAGLSFEWNDAARADMKDYNRDDLSI